jgi:hypothetical protein
MSQRLIAIEQEAEDLFGKMRRLTKEEIAIKKKMYESISEPTGANFFDLLDDT